MNVSQIQAQINFMDQEIFAQGTFYQYLLFLVNFKIAI